MGRWEVFRREVDVGSGTRVAEAVAAALTSWDLHRRAGLVVTGGPAHRGECVVLRWRLGPLHISAPVEVVEVHEGPDRAGFTYRALPGHPEEGAETFLVERDESGRVTFRISARSRPATWWARMGAPVARLVQRRITSAYLRAAGAIGAEANGDLTESG